MYIIHITVVVVVLIVSGLFTGIGPNDAVQVFVFQINSRIDDSNNDCFPFSLSNELISAIETDARQGIGNQIGMPPTFFLSVGELHNFGREGVNVCNGG